MKKNNSGEALASCRVINEMPIWTLKRKGPTSFRNMMFERELTITTGSKETKILGQLCFYRKKDAVLYMKTKSCNEFIEVVKCKLPGEK